MTSDITTIARMCHEVNKAWCELHGDYSQPDWENAPDWQRESAENGVVFHIENPDAGDSASHDNWMKEKIADGWLYGPVKQPEHKRHPCMVPFEELPWQQRKKDALFRAVVHALAAY